MDKKKKKRRTVGIILMWIGGVLTDANESTNIEVYPEMESTYIFYKESRTEVVTLPEELAKRQIAPEADVVVVDLEDVEGFVLNHRDENMQSWISYGMLAFSFVYIIPFILFLAGVIVFVVNKEKNNF